MKLALLDRPAWLVLVGLTCMMLWQLSQAVGVQPIEPKGSVVSSDFTSSFGTHHVLTQISSVKELDVQLRQHVSEALALKAAVKERIP